MSEKVTALIEAFSKLPTIGPKTAQRLAFYVLEHNRSAGGALGEALLEAVEHVGHCTRCRNFAEDELCSICASPCRNQQQICVVEHASDIAIIEQSHLFDGTYFVLMGQLSPIDGIGPEQLGLEKLDALLHEGVEEVILATSGGIEGEVTAQYIANMAEGYGVKATRLAQGVPVGGELEYLDGSTLAHAFNGRKLFD